MRGQPITHYASIFQASVEVYAIIEGIPALPSFDAPQASHGAGRPILADAEGISHLNCQLWKLTPKCQRDNLPHYVEYSFYTLPRLQSEDCVEHGTK